MPRWLLPLACVLLFSPLGAAFVAHAWPIVMRRPVPEEFGEDLFLISILGLLLSGFVTMLLTASQPKHQIRQ